MDALEEVIRMLCSKQVEKVRTEFSTGIDRVQSQVSVIQNALEEKVSREEHGQVQNELRQKVSEEHKRNLSRLEERLAALEGNNLDQIFELHYRKTDSKIQDLHNMLAESASLQQLEELSLRTQQDLSSIQAMAAEAHTTANEKVSSVEFSTIVNGLQENIGKMHDVMGDSFSKHSFTSAVDSLKGSFKDRINQIQENLNQQMSERQRLSEWHLQQQVQVAIQTVKEQITKFSDQITGINDRLDISVSEKTLKESIDGILRNIGDVQSKAVQQQMSDQTKSEQKLEEAVRNMEADIQVLQESVGLKASTQQFDDAVAELQDQVLELDELVRQSSLQGTVTSIQQHFTATCNGIIDKVANTEELFEDMQEALAHKVCEKDFTAVAEKVATLQSSFDDMVSTQAFGQVVAGVDKDVAGSQKQEEQQPITSEMVIEMKHVRKELEEMREQWKHLGGHMNPNQRIQHVKDVKQENNQLRDELLHVRKQLFRQSVGSPTRKADVGSPRRHTTSSSSRLGGC